MAQTGISASVWKEQRAMTGYQNAPALQEYDAEICKITQGVSEKKNPPEPYITVTMELEHPDLDREDNKMKHSEFFALSEDRLGFLKAFLEGIGRCDAMVDDFDWDDLNETVFRCDIKHATGKNGQVYANIDLNTIQAQSHDIFEIPEQVEEAPEEPEKPAPARKGASPRRSPRARADR